MYMLNRVYNSKNRVMQNNNQKKIKRNRCAEDQAQSIEGIMQKRKNNNGYPCVSVIPRTQTSQPFTYCRTKVSISLTIDPISIAFNSSSSDTVV